MPAVRLLDRPYTPLRVLRAGQRNIVGAIAAEMLDLTSLSGRTLRRWHAIADPAAVRHVLAEAGSRYPRPALAQRILRPAVPRSLLLCDDDGARWQRRAMRPAIDARAIGRLRPEILRLSARAASALPPGRRFRLDGFDYMTRVSIAVIGRVIDATGAHLCTAEMQAGMPALLDRFARVGLLDLLALVTALGPRRRSLVAWARRQAEAAVAARLAAGAAPEADLLQRLIEAVDPETGAPMDRHRVRDNILFMAVAGFESTAAALGWALWLLAAHPEVQEAARAEAIRGFDADGAPRSGLETISRVIAETMRLYPPVPLLFRQARHPDRIGRCPVQRGDFMFLPLYAMHRHRRLWQQPDAFRPDRFGPADAAGRSRDGFMPFGAGARACSGATLALTEMKLLLADFLRRFRFRPAVGRAPPPPVAILVLKPEGGVWLDVERIG